MRAEAVVLVAEGIEAALLRGEGVRGRLRGFRFQGAVHPLVTAVLFGVPWLDEQRPDPQLHTPRSQRGEAPRRAHACEGRTVIAQQGPGAAIGAKAALEGVLHTRGADAHRRMQAGTGTRYRRS